MELFLPGLGSAYLPDHEAVSISGGFALSRRVGSAVRGCLSSASQPHPGSLVRRVIMPDGSESQTQVQTRFHLDSNPSLVINVLFVYGTLLRGESAAPQIERFAPLQIEPAQVQGALIDFGEWPGLVVGNGLVHGELVTFANLQAALPVLDRYEDFPGYDLSSFGFRRGLANVHCSGGTNVLAWTYRFAGPVQQSPLPSGDWRKRFQMGD